MVSGERSVNDSDYVVARGTGIPGLDGTWFDRAALAELRAVRPRRNEDELHPEINRIELHPTGMIDVRDDGAVAEIWAPRTWIEFDPDGDFVDVNQWHLIDHDP